jgi:hypothetical protein
MPADDSADAHHGDYQGKSYQNPWHVFPLAGRHFSYPTALLGNLLQGLRCTVVTRLALKAIFPE